MSYKSESNRARNFKSDFEITPLGPITTINTETLVAMTSTKVKELETAVSYLKLPLHPDKGLTIRKVINALFSPTPSPSPHFCNVPSPIYL